MNEDSESLEERLFDLKCKYEQTIRDWSKLKYGLLGASLLAITVSAYSYFSRPPQPTHLPQPSPTLETVIVMETLTPTHTPIPSPTYTAIPTNTPAPMPTSTLTPTHLPPTPIRTPTPTSTPTPVVTPTLVGYKYSAPKLFSPEPWEHFRDANDKIVFSWWSVGQLEEDEYYELLIRNYIPTRGYGSLNCQLLLTKDIAWVRPPHWRHLSCGFEYPAAFEWAVHIVKVENGKVVQELSPKSSIWIFNWSP